MSNQQAIIEMMENAGRAGADWRERREQRKYNEQRRIAYLHALQLAQDTGELPDEFQETYAADYYGRQRVLATVLLRELAKLNPKHPLLNDDCRKAVSTVGMILYNRDNRPREMDYANYAPDEEITKRIFDAYTP